MKLEARKSSASRIASKPGITLRPDARTVEAGGSIAVAVDLRGLASVELSIEPSGSFALSQKSLARSGVVRLKGRRHGTATLIAEGRAGGRAIRKLLHIACEGLTLALGKLEYIPRNR